MKENKFFIFIIPGMYTRSCFFGRGKPSLFLLIKNILSFASIHKSAAIVYTDHDTHTLPKSSCPESQMHWGETMVSDFVSD